MPVMRAGDPGLKRKRKKENRSLSWHVVDSNTAWLNAECIWYDNRVCFLHQNSVVVPSGSLLARAQRQLYRLSEQGERSARAELKGEYRKNIDIDDWREHRLAKLELAKLLSTICIEHSFESIVAGANRGKGIDLQSLGNLLIAESVIFTELPFSASKALTLLADSSCEILHGLTQRKDIPSNARRLAALILGANLKQSYDRKFSASSFSFREEELRRSFYWGLKNGCTGEDAFFARILQDREGLDLSARICTAQSRLRHLNIKAELSCRMLSAGIETNRLVELIEGLAAMEPLYVEMYRQQFDDHQKFTWNKTEREERQSFAIQWKKLFFQVLLFCMDTRALVAMTSISQWILSLYRADSNHARVFFDIFNMDGFTPSLFSSYLRVLDIHSEQVFCSFEQSVLLKVQEKNRLSYCWANFAFPIRKLLISTQDPTLVDQIVSRDVSTATRFSQIDWHDSNEVKQVWHLHKKFSAEIYLDLAAIHSFITKTADLSLAVQIVEKLIMAELEASRGAAAMPERISRVLSFFAARKNGLKELERLLPDVIPKFLKVTPMCCGHNRIEEMLLAAAIAPLEHLQWLDWFYDELLLDKSKNNEMGCMQRDFWRAEFMLATALSGGNFERMKTLLPCLAELVLPEGYLFHFESMAWLHSMHSLVFAFRTMLSAQSGRAISLLQNMLLIHQVCREPMNELQTLSPSPNDWTKYLNPEQSLSSPFVGFADSASSWSLDETQFECWKNVCIFNKDIARIASAFLVASGQSCNLPKSILKELNYKNILLIEKAFLEKVLQTPANDSDLRLRKRIENIDKRLADPATHMRFMSERIKAKLEFHLADQIFTRAEGIVLSTYKRRIADIIGFYPKLDSFDDDLFYAALLWLELRCNKALLRKLLKACMQNDNEWRLRLPANKNYLESMKDRGLDVSSWLSEFTMTFSATFVRGGKVRLYMERDPLKVLRMGHYFNTCLKFGGVNSFSVVTNAVDVNKRVIYATDAGGKIIARKLICIANEKTLLGYHMYFPTAIDEQYDQLLSIFKDYCQTLASKVGLEFGDDGEPQTLCAEDWYDDIPVSWEKVLPKDSAAEDIATELYSGTDVGPGAGFVPPADALVAAGSEGVNPDGASALGHSAESKNGCALQRIRNRNSSRR